MICPDCQHENIPGVDDCDNCGQGLTGLDQPVGHSPLETTIMEARLDRLHPRPAVIVPPETTVAETITTLREQHIGCVLVGEPDDLLGIFSERDVLLRVAHRYDEIAEQAVSEFMTTGPETLEVDTPIAFAFNKMSSGDYRHVPVTRDGRVEGVVSLRDTLRFLSEEYPDLIPPG